MNDRSINTASDIEELIGELAERYAEELRMGREPDVEAYIREYPEAADAIRQILPTLEVMASVANDENLQDDEVELQSSQRELGDFRILREIGRGGMGVVYEAEQLSIGRRVALKVLPFASVLDRQQLNRFKNEARAAGTLDHPNIVAVHAVGVERGVHYYAMQLIEGQSLAQLIEQLRRESGRAEEQKSGSGVVEQSQSDTTPALPLYRSGALSNTDTAPIAHLTTLPDFDSRDYFRAIAQLGIQAAEALDHAHQNGILHRDIKPANLLVEECSNHAPRDEKCSHLAPRDGTNPRQGRGFHHAERDAYTLKLWITDFGLARMEQDAGMTMTGDILGTLRYMSPEQALAKRVVVDHRSDIYSLGVTLYELLTLQPAFTGDDRQELLRQIAFEEPRKLRQVSPRIPLDLETVILKSIEKNPADRYDSAQEFADDLRRFAEDRSITARRPTPLQRFSKWSRRHVAAVWAASLALLVATIGLGTSTFLIASARDEAVAAHRATKAEAERAQQNLRLAIESLDHIYTELIGKQLANVPHLTRVREQFLRAALSFYQRFARQNQADERSWAETGRAFLVEGRIHAELGDFEKAGPAYERSVNVFSDLLWKYPIEDRYRRQAAEAMAEFGEAWLQTGLVDTAIGYLSDAFKTLEPLGDPATDESLAAQLESAGHASLLASIHFRLGNAFALVEKSREAQEAYRRALRLQRPLVERVPENPDYHHAVAETLTRLAMLKHTAGQTDEAHTLIEQGVESQRCAVGLAPNLVDNRRSLRNQYHVLGSILHTRGDTERAIEAYHKGNTLAAELARDFPDVLTDQLGSAFSYFSLAKALLEGGQARQAEVNYRQCLSCWKNNLAGQSLLDKTAVFYDTVNYHRDSVVLATQSDAPASFRQAIKLMLGKSSLDAMLSAAEWGSIVERKAKARGEADDDDLKWDIFCNAFDQCIILLDKNDLDGARYVLQFPLLREESIKSFLSSEFARKHPGRHVVNLFFQTGTFRLGHARALLSLAEELRQHQQDIDDKTETSTHGASSGSTQNPTKAKTKP